MFITYGFYYMFWPFFFGRLQVGINFCKLLYLSYMGVCEVFRVRDLACCVGVVVWVHESCVLVQWHYLY